MPAVMSLIIRIAYMLIAIILGVIIRRSVVGGIKLQNKITLIFLLILCVILIMTLKN